MMDDIEAKRERFYRKLGDFDETRGISPDQANEYLIEAGGDVLDAAIQAALGLSTYYAANKRLSDAYRRTAAQLMGERRTDFEVGNGDASTDDGSSSAGVDTTARALAVAAQTDIDDHEANHPDGGAVDLSDYETTVAHDTSQATHAGANSAHHTKYTNQQADTRAAQRFTDFEKQKLLAIEVDATSDQTDAQIVAAVNTELGNDDWQTPGVAGEGGGTTVGVNPVGDDGVIAKRLALTDGADTVNINMPEYDDSSIVEQLGDVIDALSHTEDKTPIDGVLGASNTTLRYTIPDDLDGFYNFHVTVHSAVQVGQFTHLTNRTRISVQSNITGIAAESWTLSTDRDNSRTYVVRDVAVSPGAGQHITFTVILVDNDNFNVHFTGVEQMQLSEHVVGAGTMVEANPTGTTGDDLNRISIDGVAYNIPAGTSGGGSADPDSFTPIGRYSDSRSTS